VAGARQEITMSLNYGQLLQLRRIEVGLRRSDPHLGAMFGIFGRLYPDRDLPAWEQPQLPSGQGRIRRAAAWIAAALTVAATTIGARLSWAVTVAAARWPSRSHRRAAAPAAAPPGGNGDRRAA
jgi:hypothetical protein